MERDCDLRVGDERFRYRAAAIIVEEGSVLYMKNNVDDYYYSIGGGVHMNETSEDAVKREVFEELGEHYEVDHLAFVHENFFEHSVGTLEGLQCHEVAMYYLMKPKGKKQDFSESQTTSGIREKAVWLPLEKLEEYTVYPSYIKEYLALKEPRPIQHLVIDERKGGCNESKSND